MHLDKVANCNQWKKLNLSLSELNWKPSSTNKETINIYPKIMV